MFVNKRPEGYTSNCPGDDTKETGIHICEVVVMGKFRRRYKRNRDTYMCICEVVIMGKCYVSFH